MIVRNDNFRNYDESKKDGLLCRKQCRFTRSPSIIFGKILCLVHVFKLAHFTFKTIALLDFFYASR